LLRPLRLKVSHEKATSEYLHYGHSFGPVLGSKDFLRERKEELAARRRAESENLIVKILK
jgi:hypothetical protein